MPTIDVSNDYVVFDNTQIINLLNPDGSGGYVPFCLQQGVDTVLSDMGDGTLGYRTFCVWNLWRKNLRGGYLIWSDATDEDFFLWGNDPSDYLINSDLDVLIPQLNSKITDKSGTSWYVSAVNLDVWGNKYQLECEAEAGTAVKEVDLP